MTEELKAKAAALVREINTQDNRATAAPVLYYVQTIEAYYGHNEDALHNLPGETNLASDAYYSDDGCWPFDRLWQDKDAVEATFMQDNQGCKTFFEYLEKFEAKDGFCYRKYIDFEKCGPFFTERAAKKFIAENAHHLNSPRVYARHAWRNPEIRMLLEIAAAFGGDSIDRR